MNESCTGDNDVNIDPPGGNIAVCREKRRLRAITGGSNQDKGSFCTYVYIYIISVQ